MPKGVYMRTKAMINKRQLHRALLEKRRRKVWLWFKNRGLTNLYFKRFEKNENQRTNTSVNAPPISQY